MKKAFLSTVICLLLVNPTVSNGQVAASMYNVNRNDAGTYDFDDHPKHNRAGRIILGTGLLVGGLAIGALASNQDYYIPNTTIYGAGGIMTLLATGLVLGSVNCLNKEIKIACNGNSVGVSMCLNSVSSQKRRL
jgi:hypothetical protein